MEAELRGMFTSLQPFRQVWPGRRQLEEALLLHRAPLEDL